MGTTNEPGVHAFHRVAETVAAGWPAWEVDAATVQHIVETAQQNADGSMAVAMRIEQELSRWPRSLVQAVLAEAHSYGLVDG